MHKKIQLLLTSKQGSSPGLLETRLAAGVERIRHRLPDGAWHLVAVRLSDDPTKRLDAYVAELGKEQLSFDAVFEIGAPDADFSLLTASLTSVMEELSDMIIPQKNAVMAGTEHVILPGQCPLMLVFALHRLPTLTSQQFHEYWLNRHVVVARKVPVLRAYRQFHADVEATCAAGGELGVDITDFEGAAQGYYQGIQDFMDIMTQPAVVADALADERKFIDHSRSVMGLYRIAGQKT